VASLATLQAIVETSPDELRGFSGTRIVFELLKSPIKLRLLSLGQGEVRSLGGDAVPEILGKLNALGNGQLREVELGIPL